MGIRLLLSWLLAGTDRVVGHTPVLLKLTLLLTPELVGVEGLSGEIDSVLLLILLDLMHCVHLLHRMLVGLMRDQLFIICEDGAGCGETASERPCVEEKVVTALVIFFGEGAGRSDTA